MSPRELAQASRRHVFPPHCGRRPGSAYPIRVVADDTRVHRHTTERDQPDAYVPAGQATGNLNREAFILTARLSDVRIVEIGLSAPSPDDADLSSTHPGPSPLRPPTMPTEARLYGLDAPLGAPVRVCFDIRPARAPAFNVRKVQRVWLCSAELRLLQHRALSPRS